MTDRNAKIRRRFENWQSALNDSDYSVRDCTMRRTLFQAGIEEAFKAGFLIIPTPEALASSPEVAALIREAEARGLERAAQVAWSQQAGIDGVDRPWLKWITDSSRSIAHEVASEIRRAIFALAPIDGLALVRELRDRAEKAEAERVSEWNKRRDADSSCNVARAACDTMRAERDRLAAANAVLEAKGAELEGALRNLVGPDCMYDGRNIVITAVSHGDAIRLVADARAALATQEAGNAQSTPPISPEEAQFNAVRYHERFGPLDEPGNPLEPRRRV